MDQRDLVLQRRVDEPVPLEAVLAGELGGDDEGGECLSAAAWLERMFVSFVTATANATMTQEGTDRNEGTHRTCL